MKLFTVRSKLPHLPLDEPLPQISANTTVSRTELNHQPPSQPLKQLLLARELKTINQAIVDLRQQQQQFITRVSRAKQAVESKRHLAKARGSSENIAYYEQELGEIQQQLSRLRKATVINGVKISDLPPLPPIPATVAEKAIVSSKPVNGYYHRSSPHRKQQKTFPELAKQLTGQLTETAARDRPEPKKLLERLKYGVIELQQKWAEVQNRLQAMESISPEVSLELRRLDLELSRLEKIVLESPQIITEIPSQPGRVTELSADSQKRARLEIAQKLSEYKENALVIKAINRAYNKMIREYLPTESKVISYASPQPGRCTELSSGKRAEASQQIRKKLAEIGENQQTQSQLKQINNRLSGNYHSPPAKIIGELEQYQGRAKRFDDLPKQVLQLQRKLSKMMGESNLFLKKTAEIKEIEHRLKINYQPQQVRYSELTPVLPKYAIVPSKQARKQAKKEINRRLAAIQYSLPSMALDNITEKLSAVEKYRPPRVKVASELYSQPYQPLPYQERERSLAKEWQKLKQRKKHTHTIELSPELIDLNQKIQLWSKATTAAKAKVVRSCPESTDSSTDPYQAGLERELKKTQNILAMILKNPALMLGKFSKLATKTSPSPLEQNAKREVQSILAKINRANGQAGQELLRINHDLQALTQAPIQNGKKLTRMHSGPVISGIELQVLEREKIALEKKLAGTAMPELGKSKELLAVEQQLAELCRE